MSYLFLPASTQSFVIMGPAAFVFGFLIGLESPAPVSRRSLLCTFLTLAYFHIHMTALRTGHFPAGPDRSLFHTDSLLNHLFGYSLGSGALFRLAATAVVGVLPLLMCFHEVAQGKQNRWQFTERAEVGDTTSARKYFSLMIANCIWFVIAGLGVGCVFQWDVDTVLSHAGAFVR